MWSILIIFYLHTVQGRGVLKHSSFNINSQNMEYTCVLYLLLFYVCVIFGQDPACSGRDQCSCVTTDNQVIDLSSLGKTDGNAM